MLLFFIGHWAFCRIGVMIKQPTTHMIIVFRKRQDRQEGILDRPIRNLYNCFYKKGL